MDKLNRRVIYLSDETWATIQEEGKRSKRTASAFVRDAVAAYGEPRVSVVEATHFGGIKPAPVIEWNPVPKPSAKKR